MSEKVRRATWLAALAAFLGMVVFYFVDDPFTLTFRASVILAVGGTALSMVLLGYLLTQSMGTAKRISGFAFIAIPLLAAGVALIGLIHFRSYFHHTVSKEEWKDDLRFLAASVARTDPSPLARTSFQEKEGKLIDQLLGLDDEQIIVSLVELMASLRDGHSNIFPVQPATGFRMFPLQLYIFSDGTYVTAAAPEYRSIVGLRLTKIGDTAIEDVYDVTKTLVGADNEWTTKDRIPLFFLCPEVLHSKGIISSEEKATFSFADERGTTVTAALRPVSIYTDLYWYFRPLQRWKYQGRLSPSTALYLREPWNNYWFTYDSNARILIFEFRQVNDQGDEGLVQFGKRLLAFANSHPVDRFIIDLRQNGGGDNTLVTQFVEDLSQNATLNRRGTLFALIGRHTFSAAVNFATLLENRTETIFVGEPTGAGPNHYGDPKRIVLPHSKALVMVSTLRHEFGDPNDSRSFLAPDIPIVLSHEDYFSGRDPVLDAALNYRAPPLAVTPLSSSLTERYAGRYLYDFDRMLQISNVQGGLKFDIEHFVTADLYPVSDATFRTARGVFELEFELNNDPHLDKILWSIGGTSRLLQRLPSDFKTPQELLEEGKLSECAAAYRKHRQESPLDSYLSEEALNNRGYEFLKAREYQQAILLFKLNVEFYPSSSNAYDSLGEADMLSGDTVGAIENYQKSLKLNPTNANARQMLRKLGA
jgi:tetratricopeptide (TPR) repeat protein